MALDLLRHVRCQRVAQLITKTNLLLKVLTDLSCAHRRQRISHTEHLSVVLHLGSFALTPLDSLTPVVQYGRAGTQPFILTRTTVSNVEVLMVTAAYLIKHKLYLVRVAEVERHLARLVN